MGCSLWVFAGWFGCWFKWLCGLFFGLLDSWVFVVVLNLWIWYNIGLQWCVDVVVGCFLVGLVCVCWGGLVDLGLGFVGWVVLCYVGCGLLLVLDCGLRWFCCGRLYVLDLVWGGFFLDFVSVLWLLILGCLLMFWCFLVCGGGVFGLSG